LTGSKPGARAALQSVGAGGEYRQRMVPLASLLPLLGSTVVKALVVGQRPGPEVWGSFSEKFLGAILVEQAQTAATLARIEAKIDRMALAPYENAMRTGRTLLEQAQRAWRRPEDRERLLHEARMQYVQAVSAAPDRSTAADAQVYLGMTWLLLGSIEDTKATLAEAALTLFPFPEFASYPADRNAWKRDLTPGQRIWALVNPGAAYSYQQEHSQRQIEAGKPREERMMENLRAVQQARRLLGVSTKDAWIFGE
jgi:hypothetical protein